MGSKIRWDLRVLLGVSVVALLCFEAFAVTDNPGDLNDDQVVNVDDLFLVINNFGRAYGAPGWDPIADANGDLVVNVLDLQAVISNFGRSYVGAPTALATATPKNGLAPLTVAFTGSGSSDPNGTIVSHAWAFGTTDTSTQANPTYTYTSAGVYTATLRVTDNGGLVDSATVQITVTSASQTPDAVKDHYATAQNGILNVPAPGVLANDAGVQGHPLVANLRSTAAHGGVVLNQDGSFTYTPSADYKGLDTFQYFVTDALVGSSPDATVTIEVGLSIDETRSALVQAQPFDESAWNESKDYRKEYLQENVPGRVWETREGAVDVPSLAAEGTRFIEAYPGAAVALAVKGAKHAPVSFLVTGEGVFVGSGRNAITVRADKNGVARATLLAPSGGRTPVLAGSPQATGTVRFVVKIVE